MGESVLAASVAKPAAIEGRNIIILYGSETGNGEEIAMELAKMTERLHFDTIVDEMDGFKLVRSAICAYLCMLYADFLLVRRTYCVTLWPSLSPLPLVRVICQRTRRRSGKTLDVQSSTIPTVLRLSSSPFLDLVIAHIQSKIIFVISGHSSRKSTSHNLEPALSWKLTSQRFNWAARKLRVRLLQLGASEFFRPGEADERHENG